MAILNTFLAWCKEHTGLLFWLVVLVNIAFRIPHTDTASIYLDEGQTMFQVKRDINSIIEDYVKKQQNAPLYFILVHFWIKITGLSVFAIRLFSVFAMAFAGGLFFLLARKTVSIGFALGASLLFLGVNDFMNFAHEARGYALIAFLSVTSFYALYSMLTAYKKRWAVLLSAVNLALLFTHYLTIYIVPSQFIIVLLWWLISKNRKGILMYVASQLATGLLFLPWVGVVLSVMPEKGDFWIPEPTWAMLKNNYYYLVNGKLKTNWTFGILGIGAIIFFAKIKSISSRKKLAAIMFFIWAFVPVLANYTVGFYIPVFLAKYTFYTSFGFVLLFAFAIYHMAFNRLLKIGVFVFCAYLSFKSINFHASKGENWKEAVAHVKTLKRDDKTVLFLQRSYVYKAFYVYYDIEFFKTSDHPFSEGEKNLIFFKERVEDLEKIEEKVSPKKVVYIRSHWRGSDPNETVKKYLEENYQLNSEKRFEKVDVLEYVKP